MAKMYTLDEKLLIGSPEIRIKDKIYPIDDREKTVRKIIAICDKSAEKNTASMIDEVLKLAFSAKDFKEIDNMNLPWSAYQELLQIVISAATGEDPKKKNSEEKEERFQEE